MQLDKKYKNAVAADAKNKTKKNIVMCPECGDKTATSMINRIKDILIIVVESCAQKATKIY